MTIPKAINQLSEAHALLTDKSFAHFALMCIKDDNQSCVYGDCPKAEAFEEAINALKAVEKLEAYCDVLLNDDPVYDNEELVDVLHNIKSILKEEE